MKPIFSGFLLVTLAACGGGSGGADNIVSSGGALTSPAITIPDVDPITDTARDASFGTILNNVRLDNGADPVTYNGQLNTAAQLHAEDMLENDYFSHVGLNGSTIGTRVQATGYNYARVGENIAAGYQTETSVLDGWVNSPGHQANNIDPRFEEFGLGYARDGNDTRWVLVLGTEQ